MLRLTCHAILIKPKNQLFKDVKNPWFDILNAVIIMNLQKYIDRYLDIEKILNTVFDGLGYCMGQCISTPDPYGHCVHSACCQGRYYKKYDLDHPAYEVLKAQRESLYGTPKSRENLKRISPCEYLALDGCVVKTHKSPICLGFMCRNSIEALQNTYGIMEYDYLGINYALEWILTGDLDGKVYDEFRDMCLKMAERVNANSD